MTTNTHGFTHGETCACDHDGCRIEIFPAQVRVRRTNPVTHEITFPLVTVDVLMGRLCGRMFGRVA
jgi:hypothetical protein